MLREVMLGLSLASLVACAPARPPSSSAEAAGSEEPRGNETTETESTTATPATADAPAADLACRAASSDGKAELWLSWSGAEATGVLRTIGPSGAITDTRVRAERHKSAIIADEIAERDLATHLATVVTENGKRRMRIVEMGQPRWAACD